MGCSSCGKGRISRVGSTLNMALVIGDPNNSVYRVRVLEGYAGFQPGAVKYVRGTGVQQLVADGVLAMLAGGSREVPPPSSGAVLYYVGGIGYPTMDAARVRSGQTGEEIIVRTLGETP